MPLGVQDTDSKLWMEGEQVVATLTRSSDNLSATISWTLPSTFDAYNGAVVLLQESALNPQNFPIDGIRYRASQDLSMPADTINGAYVVGAFYNDKLTTSVNVIDLDPTKVYFASVHAVSNVLQYFSVGRQTYPLDLTVQNFSGDIPQASTPPTNPVMGQVYYNTSNGTVTMWTGAAWVPAGTGTTTTGKDFPLAPQIGQFFYHTISNALYVWDGAKWDVANTDNQGVPMYQKQGVGTDGSYAERMHLMDVVKKQMGYPVLCVELNEDHFNIAVDNAIQEFRRRADNAYKRQYFFLNLLQYQDVYWLNDPVLGSNKIVDVIKIHRLTNLGLLTQGQNGIYGQAFLTQLFAPGFVDLTSIHLLAAYAETFSMIFAGEIAFNWNEATRKLQLFRKIFKSEEVLIECVIERTEQELLVDRYAQQWLQNWAVSEVKFILGMIRSKYGNLPGAGGGISLNGQELLSSAQEDQTELLRQIQDFEVGNGTGEFGNYSFVIG